MNTILITLTSFFGLWCGQLLAQAPEVSKEKMKLLSPWIGEWRGEGSMRMGPGEPRKSIVAEKIEWRLDGAVLLIEGLGKSADGETIVHNALAVLSYDQGANQYKFKSYLRDGRQTDAWFNPTGENTYQWGFEVAGRGKTRYSIVLDPNKKTWNEIGEYSADGNTWSKFFEMNLKKVE